MDNPKEAQARAEASFKKKQQQAVDNEKARAEYDAEARATRLKTERLKALRLAREAAGEAPAEKISAVKKTPEKAPRIARKRSS